MVREGGGRIVQSGPGDVPSEELRSKKGSEKKDFGIEGAANRKYVDRLMVSEFGETEHAMTKMYSREQELERRLQAKFEGNNCIAFQD